jgi:hypothetical protein
MLFDPKLSQLHITPKIMSVLFRDLFTALYREPARMRERQPIDETVKNHPKDQPENDFVIPFLVALQFAHMPSRKSLPVMLVISPSL